MLQTIRGLRLADYEKCAPCEHKRFCARNRGAALTATGSYTGADPFVCETAEAAHRVADERTAQAARDEASEPARVPVRLAIARSSI